MESERGQSTVEWIGMLLVVALLLTALGAAGLRVPGAALAQAVASRILCAAALADSCGDEPLLIGAYGTEVGKLVRDHMPSIFFERDAQALPVDFRRCRSTACGDETARGSIRRTDRGLPVTAFVHVIDCRPDGIDRAEAAGADCSESRAGHLYIQYWTYYADSASLRGFPVLEAAGYHHDDWEGVQIRISADGSVEERATSHHGYNHSKGVENWGSDAGIGPIRELSEAVGARESNGWGPETHMLLVSGGSHAGNVDGGFDADRGTPAHGVHLVPLEPMLAGAYRYRFAINPPWLKQVWFDPEAEGTD
ncbi:MAG: hypothetical protein WBM00_10545 [Solirubrobacterales bacterium]